MIAAKMAEGLPQDRIEAEMAALIEEQMALAAVESVGDPIADSQAFHDFERQKWALDREQKVLDDMWMESPTYEADVLTQARNELEEIVRSRTGALTVGASDE